MWTALRSVQANASGSMGKNPNIKINSNVAIRKNLEELYFSFSWEDPGCIPCQGYLDMERISLWSH